MAACRIDDDLQMVRRAQRGDPNAFRDLVKRHHAQLHSWALALVRDRDDADDVVQSALIRIHRGLAGYNGSGRFTTWLYPIIRSASADLHRARQGRSRIVNRIALLDSPVTTTQSAPEDLDRSRLSNIVLQCFGELPGRQREVFNLADLQGYSPGEIAEMIGIEAATVRTHLLRARRAIRTRILKSHPELVEGLGR